jgi:hypothetical protein
MRLVDYNKSLWKQNRNMKMKYRNFNNKIKIYNSNYRNNKRLLNNNNQLIKHNNILKVNSSLSHNHMDSKKMHLVATMINKHIKLKTNPLCINKKQHKSQIKVVTLAHKVL